MLRGLLILALMASSPPPAAAASSPFHEEFRTAYGSVLWTMMVLRWCNDRWDRPRQTAAAEARLKAINSKAVRRGLGPQMRQAADDNARQMAVMRLDVRCSQGFERPHSQARNALSKAERLLRITRNG